MTRKKPGPPKGSGGRPRLQFDLSQVEGLGAIMATNEEIAAVFGCNVDTIYDRLKNDREFSEAIERGRAAGKLTLRRAQQQAVRNGNVTMMIWLGKQWLDQRDKADIVTAQDHERFRAAYIRAGTELVTGLRAGGDLEQLIGRFIAEVRGDEESQPETAHDEAVGRVN